MEAIGVAANAKRIVIGAGDRRELERLVRSRTAQRRAVERARIVLAAAEGRSAARIAGEVGCSERTVWKWRCRFEMDAPRPGRGVAASRWTRPGQAGRSCMDRRREPS
jgi:Homeodomain-like domain